MAAVSRGVQTVANGQQWQHAQVAQLLAGRRPDGGAAAGRGAALWPQLPQLPQPMMPGNFEANGSSCHLQVSA